MKEAIDLCMHWYHVLLFITPRRTLICNETIPLVNFTQNITILIQETSMGNFQKVLKW